MLAFTIFHGRCTRAAASATQPCGGEMPVRGREAVAEDEQRALAAANAPSAASARASAEARIR
jgi:hypothetical protein